MEEVSFLEGDSLPHLVGSYISVPCCLFVMITYIKFKPLRRHPSSIFFWMTTFNLVGCLLNILEVHSPEIGCEGVAEVMQFTQIGQEFYLMTFSVDLVQSLNNPFTSSHKRTYAFHAFVVTISASLAVVLNLSGEVGRSYAGICWIRDLQGTTVDHISLNLWTSILFVVPMAVVYLTCFITYIWAKKRLQQGLPTTYETRTNQRKQLVKIVGGFTLYWSVILIMITIEQVPEVDSSLAFIVNMMMGGKGVVHLVLWIMTQKLCRRWRTLLKGEQDEIQLQIESINWALRSEIMYYTTEGIRQAVLAIEEGPVNQPRGRADSVSKRSVVMTKIGGQISTMARRSFGPGLKRLEFRLTEEGKSSKTTPPVLFHDYSPLTFERLRNLQGISSDAYLESMSHTTQERFSEGKSGAFLYFTHDRRYIVKTCTTGELKFLLHILPKYEEFMTEFPESLINLISGAHSITMYNKVVNFIVIQTAFDTDLPIHDRYDLKGSWYGRLERPKTIGTKVKCKYCSQKYVVGGTHNQICPLQRAGLRHQYDRVGKDLNWNKKMHLPEERKARLVRQLTEDAHFLASIKSLDYSLLVGVHNRSFKVNVIAPNASPQESQVPFYKKSSGGMEVDVVEGAGVYFLAIIDILKDWSFTSKMEWWCKTNILRQDREGISCQDPDYYASRFVERVVMDIIKGQDVATQLQGEGLKHSFNNHNKLPLTESKTNGSGVVGGGVTLVTLGDLPSGTPLSHVEEGVADGVGLGSIEVEMDISKAHNHTTPPASTQETQHSTPRKSKNVSFW